RRAGWCGAERGGGRGEVSRADGASEEPADAAEPSELFYRGTIIRFSRATEMGLLRTASGREVPFDLRHVIVLGPLAGGAGRQEGVEAGLEVGFDLGWTSRGLRVTKLFPAPAHAVHQSEGKAGDEGEVASDELAREDGKGRDVEEPGGGHGLRNGED